MTRPIKVQIQPARQSGGNAGLYLLDGLRARDDWNAWTHDAQAQRLFLMDNITLVMPVGGQVAFYSDWERPINLDGNLLEYKWETFLTEELPGYQWEQFGVAPNNTAVAGLSMGGFGAFKLALNRPDRFAAAASLSGAVDPASLSLELSTGHLAERVWGGRESAGTADDLLGLVGRRDPAELPALFLDCGTEDQLIDQNRRFLAAAEDAGVEVASRLRPGAHTWEFWDEGIQDVLDWLPVQG